MPPWARRPSSFPYRMRQAARSWHGTLRCDGTVANWQTGSYYTAIFDELEAEGRYCVVVDDVRSDCFEIRSSLITMRMLNGVCYYFKAQRDSGEWNEADRCLPFKGPRRAP